ncbi:MAG TPA: shikimate kinase [Gemmatimonadales bacterium]|nr:shikimate kinase [Gemmatimonadales bacterium]
MPRHVVLIGLPGSGKSTVGQLAAEGLGAPLFDIDNLLVRQMGRPVAQIFGMMGEAAFRQMERDAVIAALGGPPAVIVPGGGWAAQPGQLETVRPSSIVVYLRCSPSVAVRRTEQGEDRPLLAGNDPAQRMKQLLEAREPWYRLADYVVDADVKKADQVAREVEQLARRHAAWPERAAPRLGGPPAP